MSNLQIPQRDWTVEQLIVFLRTDESKQYLSVKARTVLLNTLEKLVRVDALIENQRLYNVYSVITNTLENMFNKQAEWKREMAEACNWFYENWGDMMGCSPLYGRDS